MVRVALALLAGSLFVAVVYALARRDLTGPLAAILLLPGLIASTFAPDSHFVLKENNPAGPISTLILWTVNIGLYSGMAYALLRRFAPGRHTRQM